MKQTETSTEIDANDFAKLLEEVYEYEANSFIIDVSKIRGIPDFTMDEIQHTLKKMKNRKSEDMAHIVIEMIKNAGVQFLTVLLDMINSILATGATPRNWHVIIFKMLPKSGDLSNANNWRPIVVLPVLYKIFSELLHIRLQPLFEKC